MNAPAWRLPGGGKSQPPVIERAIERTLTAGRDSALYNALAWKPLDNGQQRKQPLRMHRFDADRRTLAALFYCTDLVTLCAGKRSDNTVVGVSRARILSLADGLHDRRLSRVLNTFQRAGFITRRRRSGQGNGHAIGKATLFGIARELFKLLGLGDLLTQNRDAKMRQLAGERAHLEDLRQDARAGAAAQRRGDALAVGQAITPKPPGAS